MKKTLSAKELAAVSEVLEDTAFLKKMIDGMSNSALLMPEIEAEALRRLAAKDKNSR